MDELYIGERTTFSVAFGRQRFAPLIDYTNIYTQTYASMTYVPDDAWEMRANHFTHVPTNRPDPLAEDDVHLSLLRHIADQYHGDDVWKIADPTRLPSSS